jgi:adenosylcobinamide-GDP ribazoletransferase
MAFAPISAVAYVALSAWMTRMFHLDGFCDACDAFTSMAATPAERLEIMKDPHPGAAAVCASIILILTKFTLIFTIILNQTTMTDGDAPIAWKPLALAGALISIPVVARFAMTLLAWLGTYPRKNGTGRQVIEKTGFAQVAAAAATLLPLAIILSPWRMLAVLAAAVIAAIHWLRKSDKLLGGVTGDILGACCETAECAVALAVLLVA